MDGVEKSKVFLFFSTFACFTVWLAFPPNFCYLLGQGNSHMQTRAQAENHAAKMEWFRRAKYGMFIHWGLYTLPGGEWKGREAPFSADRYRSLAEWIMRNMRIPLAEYRTLAASFNPADFDARRWVQTAKECGMKYLVFTAKHHDGFSMFDTKHSDYNIVKATPFGRDAVCELADACKEAGLVFCVYYSQYQDWEDPNAFGNTWDFPDEEKKDFAAYLENKVKPQLTELLSNYGKIGFVWFDTPYEMPKKYCEELVRLVRGLQPECLVNSRVGYGLGDFREMGDNGIPLVRYNGDFQTPMTLNDSWGWSVRDDNWKSAATVQNMLMAICQKGGNFLLNVGPDGAGNIPRPSLDILRTVGAWLKTHGESIYETTAAPDFPYQLFWGGFTRKEKTLYLHVTKWPSFPHEIYVVGLETRVVKAYFLADGKDVEFVQIYESGRDEHRLRVQLPKEPRDPLSTVVVLELADDPVVQTL